MTVGPGEPQWSPHPPWPAPQQVQPLPPGPAEAWRPRPYPQLLRGPTFRWWRPMLAVAIAVGLTVVTALLLAGAALVLRLVAGERTTDAAARSDDASWLATPAGLLSTNLTLAALIPLVLLTTWASYGWRPRWVSSVAPGLRWSWLLRCALVAAVVLGGTTVGLDLLSGYRWTPEADWPSLVLVVLLTTPLQAAGEEYLFRGWIPQLVGSAVPGPIVGAVLGGAISSTLFALAHGQQDVWLFADRFAFGVLACWLAWRTGGLEAGIALHGVNNLVALLLTIGSGQLADALNASEGSFWPAVFDVGTLLVTVWLVTLWARRRPMVRLFVPPPWPVPPPPAAVTA